MSRFISIFAFVVSTAFFSNGYTQLTTQSQQFSVTDSPQYMTVNMGGLLDGENTYTESNRLLGGIGFEPMISLRISNLGDKTIDAPRLVINNERRWFDFDALVSEFMAGVQNNKEKALSIWKLMRDNRFHHKIPVGGCNPADPLKSLGFYGYMTCGYASTLMTSIGTGLGYSGRTWHLRYSPQPERGHAVAEIDLGDGDVILDLDAHVFFLDYDNQTLIGNAEVVADRYLVRRTHFFGKSRSVNLDMGVMYNPDNISTGAGNCIGHSLDIALRPGESIIYDWREANQLHHIILPVPDPFPWHIANSQFVYQPAFETAELSELTQHYENIRVTPNTGQSPVIHADQLNSPSYFDIQTESPFVMLDGGVKIYAYRATLHDTLKLEFSLDGFNWSDIWEGSALGTFADSVDFSASGLLNAINPAPTAEQDSLNFFHSGHAHNSDSTHWVNDQNTHTSPLMGKYRYFLRFRFSPTDSANACGIDSVQIATRIQTSRRFMPHLRLDDNILEYTDSDVNNRNVQVEIRWQESTANTPPEIISSPVFPSDGGEPEHTQFTFAWNAPADPNGDAIIDYEFQLSDRDDMRFPLSTNFEMYLSAFGDTVKPEFQIPLPGLLNAETPYYWQVRAKDANGAWGKWSPVWSFIPQGVMMPIHGEVVENENEYYLQWQTNPTGDTPAYYEIHGSNIPDGFTADSSTVIGISSQQVFNLSGNIYAYYRVIAYDGQDRMSGPSRAVPFERTVSTAPPVTAEIPLKFELLQNYPNPFNPATVIPYTLPRASYVTLRIFNLVGQEVRTLIDEMQPTGSKSVIWDGKDAFNQQASSGVYLFRIRAGGYIHTRKMVLMH